tara:strand:+ start:106 stop:882 length:777 start_codon:yes stop_codon:yes gene_type:complete
MADNNKLPELIEQKIFNYKHDDILFPNNNLGCNPVEWVSKNILPHVQKIDNIYEIPNPVPDFQRFSGLHSWYKHLYFPTKFYPSLRIGNEPKNSLYIEECDGKIHWCFIQEATIFSTFSNNKNPYALKNQPWKIMNDLYLVLDQSYSNLSFSNPDRINLTEHSIKIYEKSLFFYKFLFIQTSIFIDRICRILLAIDPNPPSSQFVIAITNNIPKDEKILINGKYYKCYTKCNSKLHILLGQPIEEFKNIKFSQFLIKD